jgi:magnesium-transporting ATPase (P-type)
MKVPFNSSRKRMSTIVDYHNSAHVFIKGASELVLASSHQWFNSHSGEIEELT